MEAKIELCRKIGLSRKPMSIHSLLKVPLIASLCPVRQPQQWLQVLLLNGFYEKQND